MSRLPLLIALLMAAPASAQTPYPLLGNTQAACTSGPVLYSPSQGFYCSSVGSPIGTTLTTTSGSATFNYSASSFSAVPTVECTVENASTSVAYIAQISSKSITQAIINVLSSQPPVLSGSLLNIASIVVGQPFAPSTSTPNGTAVDCIAAMPTQ